MYLVVSALLSFMSISGIFGKNNLSGLSVHVDVPREVFAGSPAPIRLVLRNGKKFFPSFLIRVNCGGHDVLFPYVASRGEASRQVDFTFPKRGEENVQVAHLSSVFPFSFFFRFRKVDRTFQVIVFPELRRCELLALFQKQTRDKGDKDSDRGGFEADMISIREYVLGDPLKYINWKATAKTGKLKTKELSSLAFQPMIIDFDKVMVRDVEERISCIAYSLVQILRRNIPVGLKLKTIIRPPDTSLSHRLAMLTDLALYDSRGQR